MLQGVNSITNVERLVKDQLDLHPFGYSRQVLQSLFDAINYRDCVGASLFQDRDIDRPAPIDSHGVALDRSGIGSGCDIAQKYRRPVGDFDRDVIQVFDKSNHAIAEDVVIEIADIDVTGWD